MFHLVFFGKIESALYEQKVYKKKIQTFTYNNFSNEICFYQGDKLYKIYSPKLNH